jgi:hypothetical protein
MGEKYGWEGAVREGSMSGRREEGTGVWMHGKEEEGRGVWVGGGRKGDEYGCMGKGRRGDEEGKRAGFSVGIGGVKLL